MQDCPMEYSADVSHTNILGVAKYPGFYHSGQSNLQTPPLKWKIAIDSKLNTDLDFFYTTFHDNNLIFDIQINI